MTLCNERWRADRAAGHKSLFKLEFLFGHIAKLFTCQLDVFPQQTRVSTVTYSYNLSGDPPRPCSKALRRFDYRLED